MRSEFDHQRPAFANILLPSLVIRGDSSAISLQRSAEILSEALANASLCTIPKAGHFIPVTHAAALGERIGNHVSKTEALAWSSLSMSSPSDQDLLALPFRTGFDLPSILIARADEVIE